jgi:hypothetical protein
MTMGEQTTTRVELVCETPDGGRVVFPAFEDEREARHVCGRLREAIESGECRHFVAAWLRRERA